MKNRFSASEALQHPWINVEGHQDVVHQKHLLTACNSFRLKKNEVVTDKKETSFKREERKSLSDRKDVLYKRDSINKRDTKLSPVRTSRRCLPGKHIHSICIPHISLLSSSVLSSPLYRPITYVSFVYLPLALLTPPHIILSCSIEITVETIRKKAEGKNPQSPQRSPLRNSQAAQTMV